MKFETIFTVITVYNKNGDIYGTRYESSSASYNFKVQEKKEKVLIKILMKSGYYNLNTKDNFCKYALKYGYEVQIFEGKQIQHFYNEPENKRNNLLQYGLKK